jgi:hypothetical protein
MRGYGAAYHHKIRAGFYGVFGRHNALLIAGNCPKRTYAGGDYNLPAGNFPCLFWLLVNNSPVHQENFYKLGTNTPSSSFSKHSLYENRKQVRPYMLRRLTEIVSNVN